MADTAKDADMADSRALADFARLVADLTHDLRVPLGSIVGAASTLGDYAEKIGADKRDKLCASIIERGQYLEHLLTSLAVIAKARTGALTGEGERIELNELLLGLVSRARDRAGERIHIHANTEPLFVTFDPATLTTLVFAMLDLAVFRTEEETAVELVLSREGGDAVLSADTGATPAEGMRLVRLLDRLSGASAAATPATAEAVMLSAVIEVVRSLGGQFTVRFDETEGRLRLTARLPTGD